MTGAHEMLSRFVARIERLDEEAKAIREDRKDVFAEAKGHGFDGKALREVLRRRRMEPSALADLDELVAVYESALHGLPRGAIDGGELSVRALPAPEAKLPKGKAALGAWLSGGVNL